MGRYQDALDTIFSYVNYEKKVRYPYDAVTFDLSRMERILALLGRPHDRFQCVHIAGTKGKGSTSAMVESVLRAAGYKTGLFTSPHLHTFRERIRYRGGLMSKAQLVDLLERCRPAIDATPDITAFEVMTALAFQFFAEQGVDWAVLEVGLGGRLDATNVVHPAVCAITSLSYDHMELLGHTLSLIAFEKAGIIKAGVPVVSAPQEPEAMAVIQRVSQDIGARLTVVGQDWTCDSDGRDLTGQYLTIRGPGGRPVLSGLRIALLGQHQRDNATVAVAMLHELREHLKSDPAGAELLKRLECEIPIKENPRGIPSLWYIPLVTGDNFFDGFGFAPYRRRLGWREEIPIDRHERRFPPQRPLLPFLEKLNERLPKKWDSKLNRFVQNDDWLLWDFHSKRIRGKHVESARK